MRRSPSLLARQLAKLEVKLGPLADPRAAAHAAGERGEFVPAPVAEALCRELRRAGEAGWIAGGDEAALGAARALWAGLTPAARRAVAPHVPRLLAGLRAELARLGQATPAA
ncbi:MAG: hypothetical protein KJ058_19035 [Thermoanaerobaculia bacterium]|nr:hypothetical protein [Thermoanaerobaculia bacterium]